jgi:serine/threonine protein kinase
MASTLDSLTKESKIHLLNQGSYGCVFQPAVKCNGLLSSKRFVTKIQEDGEFTKNEVAVSAIIKKIKNYSLRFAPIIRSCPISLGKIQEKELSKCEHIQMNSKKVYFTNIIKFVGKYTLFDYLFVLFQSHPKLFLRTFMDCYFQLLQSISILNKQDVLHFDLKENNILMDDKNNLPILIDFGLSVDIKRMKPENYSAIFFTYGYDYPPWCFEMSVISYIVNKVGDDWQSQLATVDVFDKLCDSFLESNPLFQIHPDMASYFSAEEKVAFKKKLMEFLSGYQERPWIEVVDELLKSTMTWDIYGIHTIFFQLFHKFYTNETEIEHIPFLKQFAQVLKREIVALPLERKSYQDISDEVMKLFSLTKRSDSVVLLHNSVVKAKKVDEIKKLQQQMAKMKLDELNKEVAVYDKR